MADLQDLLGALLKRGMTDSSTQRIENSLSDEEISGPGGILEQELGVTPARQSAGTSTTTRTSTPQRAPQRAPDRAATPRRDAPSTPPEEEGGSLGDVFQNIGAVAKSILGGGGQGSSSVAAGGLGALLGAILGGGGKSAKGAIGGGALALLGAIAMKALRGGMASQGAGGQSQGLDAASRLAAGLRAPENDQESRQVQSILDLTVKAMINAAKADGRIDEDEMQKVVGEMQEDGISQEERDYLLAEVRKPLSTDEIVRGVSNPQVAAQVYAASLLAIEVDTPNERAYLQQLARDLRLDPQVVSRLHATLGVA